MHPIPGTNEIATLRELSIEELSDLYDSERQLAEALPRFSAAVCNDNLRFAFLGRRSGRRCTSLAWKKFLHSSMRLRRDNEAKGWRV